MSASTQFCTFFLDGHTLGTPVENVQEVIRYQAMTHVPLAPDVVRGLINLRGQIVTAVDLRKRLVLPERTTEQDRLPMNVVVRTKDGAVSLLVDEIGDVVLVDEGMFEVCPATVQGVAREMVKGVYKLSGRLLLALNIERIVDLDDLMKKNPRDSAIERMPTQRAES